MATTFEVIDLFAGPGGLGEGFSAANVDGHHPFRIRVSVERDATAHRTLRLRAFLRAYQERRGYLPDDYLDFHAGLAPEPDWLEVCPDSWHRAEAEAQCLELGTAKATRALNQVSRDVAMRGVSSVLIGGPPCQAYSIAGRVRSNGIPGYVPEEDRRHYLFLEYVKMLKAFRPVAFVMENVKGILSSAVDGKRVLEMVVKALERPSGRKGPHYDLFAIQAENDEMRLVKPQDPVEYVLRAEEFGVPQARHRVFIVGVRSDMAAGAIDARIEDTDRARTVEDAIGLLAPIRSGISRGGDSEREWKKAVAAAAGRLASLSNARGSELMRSKFGELREIFRDEEIPPRSSTMWINGYGERNDALRRWIENPALRGIAQHEARSHMKSDIERYLFASVFAESHGHSPKSNDFPRKLAPNHRNWKSGAFADRFRVQLGDEPATTITSHISKDGHHYIHYDPLQCRSLTVREAARIQTFPDDYFFLGNRTQQYVQVGNAVPPYLARKIALLLHRAIAPGG